MDCRGVVTRTASKDTRAMGETSESDCVTGYLDPWRPDELDELLARRNAAAGALIPAWQRNYSPFESQGKFHGSDKRFKGFSGPVGSGKSRALAAEAIRCAYANPGLAGVVGAPTYTMLRDVTRAHVIEALISGAVPFDLRKSSNEIYLPECGSTIRFRSLDNPERLIGSNLAWFGVDELTYCKADGWLRLEARLRDPKAKQLVGFAGWTPKGFDWVYERFLGDRKVEGYDAILAKPGENTALPPDYYDRLKASYDEKFYEQEALGKYLSVFAGQTYYCFERTLNVKPIEFDPRRPICWAMDFNVDRLSSVVCQVAGRELHVLQEVVLGNDSHTLDSCRVFRDRVQTYLDELRGSHYAVIPLQVIVYGDAAGNQRRTSADQTDWKIVREWIARDASLVSEFRVGVSNPTIKGRVNAMNAMLCNADKERRLFVDPSCRELIADLEQVAWRTDAAGNSISELDKSNPKRTHISDALGYLAEKEFGLRQVGGPRSTYLGV
jgi:phage terminase large subunit